MSGRLVTAGFWGSILLALGGVWLLMAPSWVGYQAEGAPWVAATRNDVTVGAALLLTGLLAMFAQVALGLRDLVASAERASRDAAAGEVAVPDAPQGDGGAQSPSGEAAQGRQ